MLGLLVSAALLVICHGFAIDPIPRLDGRIVGGEEIPITAASYQVALLYDHTASGLYRHACGGSILNSKVVITAAHCTDGTAFNRWMIRAGSNSANSLGQTVTIERFLHHPSYNNRLDFDISLMFLSDPLFVDGFQISIIILPNVDIDIPDGTEVVVTGWGATEEGGGPVDLLQRVIIPIVNQEICANIYLGTNPVTERMICAGFLGDGGRDACQGDSGGPMVLNSLLIGITSWGRGCGRPDFPGVWTRVSAVKQWIELETENQSKGAVLPSAPRLDGRIVGGEPADISDAPYQVSLLLDWQGAGQFAQACGGTILRVNVVLTSASCADESTPRQWRIRAGSTFANSGGQVRYTQSFLMHPNYNARLDYDIAIFFLETDIFINDAQTALVRLPEQGASIQDGALALVTGWGSIEEGGNSVNALQKVLLPVVNQQTCINNYAGINPVTDRMVCAGDEGKDACQGDSGGPMTIDGILVGITSWGLGCGNKEYPGVFTRVPVLRNWIEDEIVEFTRYNN